MIIPQILGSLFVIVFCLAFMLEIADLSTYQRAQWMLLAVVFLGGATLVSVIWCLA